jgi:hypothetical protein
MVHQVSRGDALRGKIKRAENPRAGARARLRRTKWVPARKPELKYSSIMNLPHFSEKSLSRMAP